MNILLFHPQPDQREILSFCLESQIGQNITQAQTYQEVIDVFLEEGAIDLLIAAPLPGTDKLFRFLLSTSARVPIILISEDTTIGTVSFPDLILLGQLSMKEVPTKLLSLIKENFSHVLSASSNSGASEEYCRISTQLLPRVVPLKSDVYIRLSNVKYIKLFGKGAQFTKEDCEKYLFSRKVEYFYLKNAESKEFVNKFLVDLKQMSEAITPESASSWSTISESQEMVTELINRIGFTKEVQEIAKLNVDMTLKAIGESAKIAKVLDLSKLKVKNYLSSHSVLLAHVACSIAGYMSWPSQSTFQKLSMAALFHDLVLQNVELAKISTKKELESYKTRLSTESYTAVKNHPARCSELLKEMSEIPSDVDVIILQHHERPDGNGFPRGIRASQIAPLAAVMIIGHDMIDAIEQEAEKFNLKDFLKKMESSYNAGPFRKIWQALSATLEPSSPPTDTII